MKVGDLVRFHVGFSTEYLTFHNDIDKCVGIVLRVANEQEQHRQGQYKVQIKHKTLWILTSNMEVI